MSIRKKEKSIEEKNNLSAENETLIENDVASKLLNEKLTEAEDLLQDYDKVERFLQRLEAKLKVVPLVGNQLAVVPTLISLVRSYIKKEYTDIPIGTIIAIVAGLAYVLSPVDLIPDAIPVVGYSDDAAVIAVCYKLAESDVKEYQKWRKEHNKDFDVMQFEEARVSFVEKKTKEK